MKNTSTYIDNCGWSGLPEGKASSAGKDPGLVKSAGADRADLHLHSRFSKESDLWILREAGVGESNTDPETIYRTCKKKGMTYVTLTDHNTIEGGLQLAGYDDFFLSEEVTSYFPDEDVKLHLLALGISEEQHREIQSLRKNLYELVAYLNLEGILYVLAHPLTRLGGELAPGHIERLMLLFPIWEAHNGSTLECENSMALRLAERCCPTMLLDLAERHDLQPVTRDRISFTAGSDDHAGFDIASAWTTTARTGNVAAFLKEVKAGRTGIEGQHGSTLKLAHAMMGLLASGVEGKETKEKERSRDVLSPWSFFKSNGIAAEAGKWVNLVSLATGSSGSAAGFFKAVRTNGDLRRALVSLFKATAGPGKRGKDQFHQQLFSLVNATWAAGMRSALANLSEISLFNIVDNFDRIGRLVALQALLMPHALSANYHSRQRHFLSRLGQEMLPGEHAPGGAGQPRVGLFTDTFDEVNGVTSILRRLAQDCQEKGRPLDIICAGPKQERGGVIRFPAVASVDLPEYGSLNLSIPPVLDIVAHCEERKYSVIHAATPGPMGLAALLVSRILQVPLVTSYHTDVPRCIGRITDDKLNEEIAWTYMRWFYWRSDLTFVPSAYTSRDLRSHGLDRQKMAVLYQGIDSGRFSPRSRSLEWRRRLGGDDKKILLFVGRLSQEKDLLFLAECYRSMAARRGDIHLAMVGDGPLRLKLEAALGGKATFTGWLKGEDLSCAFASADVFVFPSSVDTSGQVILEAQASGLPVVLCTEGGACENIKPGISGLTAPARSLNGFAGQIEMLLDDADLRASMAAEARNAARDRTWEKVFDDLFDTYAELVQWWQPLSSIRRSEDGRIGREESAIDFLLGAGNRPSR